MKGPRRPCWIIRVHPPLVARRMVEPPVAARSKRLVRPNLRLAACLAPLKARLARLSVNFLAAAASECRRAKSHFALPFNRLRGPPGQRSAKPYCAGSSEAKCKFLAFVG